MPRRDAVFEYVLPELLLDESLFDQRLEIPGTAAWIHFPGDYADGAQNRRLFHNSGPVAGWNEVDGRKVCLKANSVVVGVPFEQDLNLDDPEEVQRKLHNLEPKATSLFLRVAEWLRADGEHHWLATRAAIGADALMASGIYETDGTRRDYGTLRMRAVSLRYRRDAFTFEHAQYVLDASGKGITPPLWDLFLADAGSSTDIKHSVVLAAIACELAVKGTLREAASTQEAALVELLLDRPRDFSLAAATLFDEPCLAVIGRSFES